MSLRWRDEVCIEVGPRRYTLSRRTRGLRTTVVAERSASLPGDASGGWGPALEAVGLELDRPGWQRARALVVVADHWVRYAIVPWQRELSGDEERLVHGRLILRQVYGEDMAGWTLQLGRTVHGAPQVVCAIPTSLLTRIEETLRCYALRLVSLRPRLVAAFDRWRSRMPDAGGWFVTVDDGCLAAARLEGAHWSEVHRIRVGDDWATDLNRLRTFDRLARDGQPRGLRILVDAPPRLRTGGAAIRRELEWVDADDAASAAPARWRRGSGATR